MFEGDWVDGLKRGPRPQSSPATPHLAYTHARTHVIAVPIFLRSFGFLGTGRPSLRREKEREREREILNKKKRKRKEKKRFASLLCIVNTGRRTGRRRRGGFLSVQSTCNFRFRSFALRNSVTLPSHFSTKIPSPESSLPGSPLHLRSR